MPQNSLSIWTVYEKPSDFPGEFVARRWESLVEDGAPVSRATADVLVARDLDGLRAQLPAGLIRLERQPGDAPAIVESWV
jgi:hypothetical protein